MGIDIGGMFDQRKIAYVNLLTTTHPAWENGFVVILNGHAYQFHQETDFGWWLNKK